MRETKPYRGRRRWEVVAVVDGEKTRQTTYSQAEARRTVTILSAQLDTGALGVPTTWKDGVDAFLEYRTDKGDRQNGLVTCRYRLNAVGKTLRFPDPLGLRAADAKVHRKAREREKRSPVTIAAELEAVLAMQRYFVEQGWMPTATWEKADLPNQWVPAKAHLLPSEVGPWLAAAIRLGENPPKYHRKSDWERWPAAAVLLLHGLRTGELRRLKVQDLDLAYGVVYVVDRIGARTKSRSSARPVPVQSEVGLAILRRTLGGLKSSEFCFSSSRTGGMLPEGTKYFHRRVIRTCDLAGVRRVVPHGLRHTTGTIGCSLPGIGTFEVGKLLGHADPKVTDGIYNHAALGTVMKPAAALGEFIDRAIAGGEAVSTETQSFGRISVEKAPKRFDPPGGGSKKLND